MSKKEKTSQQKQPKTREDYERAGRLLFQIAEYGTVNRKKLLWISFLRGLGVGFGTVLGATILVSLLVYILSFFNEVPFLGNVVEEVTNTINQ